MFVLIGSTDISLITQPILQKIVYLSIVIVYLIITKPTLLHSFISLFFYSNFIISMDIIVVLLIWLSLLLHSLSLSICLTISFCFLLQLYYKADLHGIALCDLLVFFCSPVYAIACIHKMPSFSIHFSNCHRCMAAFLLSKSIFQLVCQWQLNCLAALCLTISIQPLLPIYCLKLLHMKFQ